MPIVIGPFNNVPAPGDPIRSDWPQQLTQYAVNTARLGLAAPPGYGDASNTPINGGPADVTGLYVSWSAVTGRRYRVQGAINVSMGGSQGLVEATITTNANTPVTSVQKLVPANGIASLFVSALLDKTQTGGMIYKLRVYTQSAATLLGATPPLRPWMSVEDLGTV